MKSETEQILELIEKRIFVSIVPMNDVWCYILYKLPSKEDIEFAKTSECRYKDLWLEAE